MVDTGPPPDNKPVSSPESATRPTVSMTDLPVDLTEPGLEKNQILERLVLETTITSQFLRLIVFMCQIMIFISNLQAFYPSLNVNLAHKSIATTLELGDMPGAPTASELLEFMRTTLNNLNAMAPGSKEYVDDPQMRKLLPDAQDFCASCPVYELAKEEEMELTPHFTALMWVRPGSSSARLRELITKRTQSGVVCWQWHNEYFAQGEHEGDSPGIDAPPPLRTFHPYAQEMYHPRAKPEAAFLGPPKSAMWEAVNGDAAWHHIGIQVDTGMRTVPRGMPRIRFILDGEFVNNKWYELPRAPTDCKDGTIVIASREPASFFDLQWFPSLLDQNEVNDIKSQRILLDDLVSSAGADPPVVGANSVVQSSIQKVEFKIDNMNGDITASVREMLKGVVKGLEVVPAGARARRLEESETDPAGAEEVDTVEEPPQPSVKSGSVKQREAEYFAVPSPRSLSEVFEEDTAAEPRFLQLPGGFTCVDDNPAQCNEVQYTYIQSESASQGAGEYPVGNADVDADGNPRAGGDVDWINDCVLGFWGADYNESPAELYVRLHLKPGPPGPANPAAGSLGEYCNSKLTDILGYLSWMDWDLCYNGNALGYTTCRATCGFCYVNPSLKPSAIAIVPPFKAPTMDAGFEVCADNANHRDMTGSGCQWYFTNGDDGTGNKCGKADYQTTMECKMTCKCTRDGTKEFQVFDFDEDGVLIPSELRSILWEHFIAGVHYGPGGIPEGSYARWFTALRFAKDLPGLCDWLVNTEGDTTGGDENDCMIMNQYGMNYTSFGPAMKLFQKREDNYLGGSASPQSTMQNMIVKIDKLHNPVRTQLLELADSGSFVQAVASDTVVSASVSLTTEPLVENFPSCTDHAFCLDAARKVMMCPLTDPNCPFGFEDWKGGRPDGGWGFAAEYGGQMQFCSKSCLTGGCGEGAGQIGTALSGGFCQPCGSCTAALAMGGACPTECDAYIRTVWGPDGPTGDSGDPLFGSAAAPAYPYELGGDKAQLVPNPLTHGDAKAYPAPDGLSKLESVSGNLVFEMWVNDPTDAWTVRKAFPDWDDEDQEADKECRTLEKTKLSPDSPPGKICWAFTMDGFCYRSTWHHKLTFVPVPAFKEKLKDKQWHHIQMTQSVEDTLNDGGPFWYGSGGPLNKRTTVAKLEIFVDMQKAGGLEYKSHGNPAVGMQYFTDCQGEMVMGSTLQDQAAAATFEPSDVTPDASKVAFGGESAAAFEFQNIEIPPSAIIKSAFIDFLPSLKAGTDPDTVGKSLEMVNLKIGLGSDPGVCMSGGNTMDWSLPRASWESEGLLNDCLVFKTLCRGPGVTQKTMKTADMKDLIQSYIQQNTANGDTMTWRQGESIFVHIQGDAATCPPPAQSASGGQTPLYVGSYLGAMSTEGSLPVLTVKYCLNEDCVSPRFYGSSPLLRPPLLVQVNGEYQWDYNPEPDQNGARRLQQENQRRQARRLKIRGTSTPTSMRSELVLGPSISFGLRFRPAQILSRLLQQYFYNALDKLTGIEAPKNIDPGKAAVEVPPLPSQIIAIAPPVMFQERSKLQKCESALSYDVSQLLNMQLKRKCFNSYECTDSSGDEIDWGPRGRLQCYDRTQAEAMDPYFGKTPTPFTEEARVQGCESTKGEGCVYAEFANMLRETTVFRGGEAMNVDSWIDQRTQSVDMLSVFTIPYNSITTVLRLSFVKDSQDGSGRFSGSKTLLSYRNIPPAALIPFTVLVAFNVLLNAMDVIFLAWCVWQRRNQKRDYKARYKGFEKTINQNIPVFTGLDLFDLVMRIWMTILLLLFMGQKSYSWEGPPADAHQPDLMTPISALSALDGEAQSLAQIEWLNRDPSMSASQKFLLLFEYGGNILRGQEYEQSLRRYSFFTLFFMLIRTIIYMNCHPRIAVLYGTITAAADDLFHFFILFTVIYSVFGFAAHWAIGADNEKYQTFSAALTTQFEMVIGEFPWQDDTGGLEFFYNVAYALIVFITLLNFLLAVIVSCYDNLKKEIDDCLVELNVVTDVWYAFRYWYKQVVYKWPSRENVAQALAAIDVDKDGKMDLASMGQFRCGLTLFQYLQNPHTKDNLFADREMASNWLDYYRFNFPVVEWEADIFVEKLLMHQQNQSRITRLAWMSNKAAKKDAVEDAIGPTTEEKAKEAAERAGSAMLELAELVPTLRGLAVPNGDMSPTVKAEPNGSHGGAPEVVAMGQHLSDKLRVLESMLSRQDERLKAGLTPGGAAAPLSLSMAPANGAAAVGGADMEAKLARVEDQVAMVLKGQEQLQRAIAMLASTQAGAMSVYGEAPRVEPMATHGVARDYASPRAAPRSEDMYGDVYPRRGGPEGPAKDQRQCDTALSECLNPSTADMENSIVVGYSEAPGGRPGPAGRYQPPARG